MTTIDQEIAEGLGPAATTLHLQDEAFPAAVEAQPYPSIPGAKVDRDGPGQPVNPDMVEAEVSEKRELLSQFSDEHRANDRPEGVLVHRRTWYPSKFRSHRALTL